jgi:hypothetical protein
MGAGPPARRGVSIAFLVFLVIALAIAAVVAVALHNSVGGSSSPSTRAKRAVIILVDGAGAFPSASMPALTRLARNGTQYDRAWIGQWPSIRPSSGATVGTGVTPRENGIAGQSWRDPTTGQEVQPTLPDNVRLGSIDQILESRRPQLTPIAAVIKDRNPENRVLAVGGVGCAPADAAASWLADYVLCIGRKGNRWVEIPVTGHELPSGVAQTASVPVATGHGLGPRVEGWQLGSQDDQIAVNAIAAIRARRPTLTVIDFPEPAAVVPFAPADQRDAVMANLLAGIDRDIAHIEAALRGDKLLSGTAFLVTSGEALSPLSRTIAVSSFSDAVIAAGGEPVYVHGGGAASIALQDSQQAESVAAALEASKLSGIDAIFYRTHHAGTWQFEPQYLDPLLHPTFGDAVSSLLGTAASAEAPDVVAVYAPHTGTPATLGTLHSTSVSGGISWDTQHIPFVLSGAGVVSGQVSHYPARLADIAATVEALLGLSPAPGNGVVLADALNQPPSGAGDQQQRRRRQLTPTVDALVRRLHESG